MEPLEMRRLLSTSLVESEPNNTRAKADAIARQPDEVITIRGKINTAEDHDWFKVRLEAGDVLGVAVTGGADLGPGLEPYARLLDSAGRVVIETTGPFFQAGESLPEQSPLPRADRNSYGVEFYRVMPKAGTYYLDVSSQLAGSSGAYRMDLMVARPGMEAAPRGQKQILFLDFDGATVDYGHFIDKPPVDPATLSPMRDFLEGFNLSLDDEDAVIDAVVTQVKRMLSADIEKFGLNGDYDRSGRAGEFDIEIRNSRDHRDTYGKDPFVARVVIGGTWEESGFDGYSGLAESLDIGNFKTNDQAVATLSWITDAVDIVSAQAPVSQIDLFALGIADLAAHEAGHLFGAVHTDQDPADDAQGVAQVMGFIGEFIGPDLVLGSDDDLKLVMGVDGYNEFEFYGGMNDTLNTLAFGLSTGTGRGEHGHHPNRSDDDHNRVPHHGARSRPSLFSDLEDDEPSDSKLV
jgi:hypothetical protein